MRQGDPDTGRTGSERGRRVSALRRESLLADRGGGGGGVLDAAIRRPSLASVAERGSWGSRWEFLLSCVGLSVGIGNVWRFPYLAYQNGGGAFLIPYLVMLGLVGKPMYFLELAVGQFGGVGPLTLWSCCPIARGVGCAMVVVSLVVCVYYNVVMSYTLYFMAASLAAEVPWSRCDPAWADMATCYVRGANTSGNSSHDINNTFAENSNKQTASLQFWERKVLGLSDGIEHPGPVKWDLAVCLLVSWVIVVLCLVRGIKTSGKLAVVFGSAALSVTQVVYFAATFPYVILLTLLVTGLMQDGAIAGVLYFITPTWDKLFDIQVWQAAAGQMFFSLSVSMGCLIMYSSYNDFYNNVYRDAMVVSVMDTATSIISGMVAFSILGAMAHELQLPIQQVVKEGPGLAFVAYPEALLRLPVPQLWSLLFFLMLFVLGLDSEFALLENVLTSVSDEHPGLRSHKLAFCVLTAAFCYLLGLPCVTHGGIYVLTLMDVYGGGMAVLFIAVMECVGLVWLYGLPNLCNDIYFMLGSKPHRYWQFTWAFSAPVILTVILACWLANREPLRYESYNYPAWADAAGWCLALLSVAQVPFWAVVSVCRQRAPTFFQKLLQSTRPTEDWGPADLDTREDWLASRKVTEPVRVNSMECMAAAPQRGEAASAGTVGFSSSAT